MRQFGDARQRQRRVRCAAEEWKRDVQPAGDEGEDSVEQEAKGGVDDERKSDKDLRRRGNETEYGAA